MQPEKANLPSAAMQSRATSTPAPAVVCAQLASPAHFLSDRSPPLVIVHFGGISTSSQSPTNLRIGLVNRQPFLLIESARKSRSERDVSQHTASIRFKLPNRRTHPSVPEERPESSLSRKNYATFSEKLSEPATATLTRICPPAGKISRDEPHLPQTVMSKCSS